MKPENKTRMRIMKEQHALLDLDKIIDLIKQGYSPRYACCMLGVKFEVLKVFLYEKNKEFKQLSTNYYKNQKLKHRVYPRFESQGETVNKT